MKESQGNGAVEAAVKAFARQLMTFTHQYEHMLGPHEKDQRLPAEHAMMNWLVLWTGEVLMTFRPRLTDGRTPYEVMTGHRCEHPGLDKTRRHNVGDWQQGMFLSVDAASTQSRVATQDCVL